MGVVTFSGSEVADARRSPPLSQIRAEHAAKEAAAKHANEKKGVKAPRKGKHRGLFGEVLHDIGDTKGIGRVALALMTGGGSEIARMGAKEVEHLQRGPGSSYPSRRSQGRLTARSHPVQGAVVEHATAAVQGRAPRTPPPVPAGKLHPQRRLSARAKNGFYKHLSEKDVS